ncbi:MAG: uncharacterized protein KVP18_000903 [Porospora cf. gigantea A]|uniref:uncharacterized protein n=1 Tax=Porospora cf. gigantea A TaxID=2853593 RepID=UPI003559D97A|nr:MAG: hypothetical protein KVP18_000903 [Porospora cf. gigantea A]
MRIVPRRGNSSVVSWLVSEAASLSPCLVAKVVASQRAARPDDIRLPAQEAISGFELRGLAPVEVDVPDLVHPITRGHSFVNEGRGYPNQDAFSFIHVFDKHKARLLYSVLTVWDGHGIDGDMLSHTLRDIFSKEVLAGLAVHAKTWGAGRMEVLQYVFSAALAMTNTRLRSYPQACMWHGGAVFVGIIVDWAARKGVCASLGDGSAFYFREVPVSLKEKLSFRHLGLDSKISFASRALSENMGVENPKYALQVVRRLALANIPGIMRLSDDNVLELIWSVSGFDRVDRTPLDTTPVVLSIDEDFDMRLNLSELAAAMADYTLPVSSRPVFHQFSIHLE